MKLFIPEIGSKLKLKWNWAFELYLESRNDALLEATGENVWSHDWRRTACQPKGWSKDSEYGDYHKTFVLPRGSELSLDRIYIRKGNSGFSSLSFHLKRASVNPDYSAFTKRIHNGKGKCRFWAKLADVNTIDFAHEDDEEKIFVD